MFIISLTLSSFILPSLHLLIMLPTIARSHLRNSNPLISTGSTAIFLAMVTKAHKEVCSRKSRDAKVSMSFFIGTLLPAIY
jgi:hypothetical protein